MTEACQKKTRNASFFFNSLCATPARLRCPDRRPQTTTAPGALPVSAPAPPQRATNETCPWRAAWLPTRSLDRRKMLSSTFYDLCCVLSNVEFAHLKPAIHIPQKNSLHINQVVAV